jgi:cellulose biosynthesis protein BcsQ
MEIKTDGVEELETDCIILNNRKGGVGKTTLTAFLAAILAALGFLVGVVDGDDQENASKLTYPRPYEGTTHAVTFTQVITQGRPLLEAMVQVRRNLWVVPSDPFLGEAALRINKLKNPYLIAELVAQLKAQLARPTSYAERLWWWERPSINLNQFRQEPTTDEEYVTPPPFLDFLLFDSPPNEDALTDAMLRAARVLIPINMDQFSIEGLKKRVDYVDSTVGPDGRPIELIGILPNEIAHKPGNTVPLEFLADVWRNFPDRARRPIHADDALKDAWAYNMTILEYGQAYAPRSRGMLEVAKLALEIAGWPGKLVGLKYCKFCAEAVSLVRAEAAGNDLELEEGEVV